MNVGLQGYDPERAQRFYDAVLSRARALPAVRQAALTFPAPFDTYDRGVGFYVEGLSIRATGRLERRAPSCPMASSAHLRRLASLPSLSSPFPDVHKGESNASGPASTFIGALMPVIVVPFRICARRSSTTLVR